MSYLGRVLCRATSKILCEAYFVAARSDENVFKITTRGKNENIDHRVTAPLPGLSVEDRNGVITIK